MNTTRQTYGYQQGEDFNMAQGVPSTDEERNLALWPALLYVGLIIVTGTVGNIVVCYVYGYRLRLTVTKQFMLVLAVLDLANCLICAPTEMAVMFKIVSFNAPVWCKVSRFLTYTLNGSTSLILLAIAVDRYCKVCRPLKVCFTKVRARRMCMLAVILSLGMSWPSLLIYGNKTLSIGGTQNGTTCLIEDDYENTWYPVIFYSVFFISFLAIAAAIISLYVKVAMEIKLLRGRQEERIRSSPVHRRISGYVDNPEHIEANVLDNNSLAVGSDSQLRPPSPRANQHAVKLAQALLKDLHNKKTAYKPAKSTLMLFIITVIFMLSFLPFFITALIRGAKREMFLANLTDTTEIILFNIFVRSYLLSNAANPVIYSFCNARFRQECRPIFCPCWKRSESNVEIKVEHTDNTQSIL
ncbi:probable G-protein coupled receptor No9 [Haliotis rubra]|uniref:probable G-protein coupled receptor No9 n=1 Tax=Haliotis rubra TaxID=36100 RepID=UPI001EE4F1D2|nr:probable G-protein coupled receptor No9 [Haliotis rubra]